METKIVPPARRTAAYCACVPDGSCSRCDARLRDNDDWDVDNCSNPCTKTGPVCPPVATAQTVNTSFRTAIAVTLTGSDPKGYGLTYTKVTDPANGTLSAVTGNQITYSPNANFGGAADVFTFKVNNGYLDSPPAAVTVNVGLPASGPTANSQTVSTAFRTAVTITLVGADPSGLALTYAAVGSPSNGTLSALSGNQITYTPNSTFGGAADSFTFKVVNSLGQQSGPATVTVNVALPANGPTANPQTVSTAFRTAVTITLVGNDPSGLPISYVKVNDPSNGTVSAVSGNQITYTPSSTFGGAADSFTFKVVNSLGQQSGLATVTVNVGLPASGPTANPQTVSTAFRTAVTITLVGVDPSGLALTYAAVGSPSNGTLSALSGNQITYTPNSTFGGAADSFTFKVVNSLGQQSGPATVTVNVALPASGPTANPQTVSTAFRTAVTITLVGVDPSGLALTYAAVGSPSNGIVSSITGNQITYTPNSTFGGAADSFTFKVVNSLGQQSGPATVTVNVGLPASGPTASAQTVSTAFRTAVTITLVGNDPSGLPISYVKVNDPSNGTVSAVSGNQITYTPSSTFGGAADSFTFKVVNSLGQQSGPATVTVNVGLPASGPTASAQTVSTAFRTAVTITLAGTDPSGLALTYAAVGSPSNGIVSSITGNQITYTPNSTFGGAADSFTFKVVNSLGQQSGPATVTVNVGLPASGPTASAQTVSTAFRTAVTITLVGNDPSGLPISYVKVNDPSNGTVSAVSGNQITYTPSSTFGGAADSFTFKVVNSLGQQSGPATVTVNVGLPASGPTANPQTVLTAFRTAVTITLMGVDPSGLALTYVAVGSPANGTVSAVSGNQITYTPSSTFGGAADSFTFKVVNSLGQQSSPAAVTVNVGLPASGPTANPQTVSTAFRTAVTITLDGTDPSGLALTYVAVGSPSNGTLSAVTGNQITYTPNSTFGGAADSFTFKVVNSLGQQSGPATVTVNVGLPTEPTASNQSVTVTFNTDKPMVLVATDPNGLPLTYTYTTPTHGTITGTAPNLVYSPTHNYNGPDSFTFKANNGFLDSNVATVSVTVNPPTGSGNAPVAQDQSVSVTFNTDKPVVLVATDPNGLPLTYTYTTPAHGTITGTAPNLVYSPTHNYNGPDSFTFKANNGFLDSNVATVTLTVNPPTGSGNAPVAQDQSVSVTFNTDKPVVLVATDPNGLPLTYTYTTPAHGTITGTAPNLVYSPTHNYNGPDSFTFKANNGFLDSNVATVTLTVNPPTGSGNAPVAQDQSVTVTFNTDKPVVLVATDPNGLPLTYTYTTPTHGTITGTAPNLVYSPTHNYNGPDSFTFKANNGFLDSNVATVTLTVNPPTGIRQCSLWRRTSRVTVTFNTDKPVVLSATDPNGLPLTYTYTTPTHGTMSPAPRRT
jgi:hypothetical protein